MSFQEADASRLEALQRENQRLQRAVQELSILNELAREIGASFELNEIMSKIIRRSTHAVQAEQGVITLVDDAASEPTKTLVRTMASSGDHQPFRLDQSLLGWMYLNKKPLLINRPLQDERFRGVRWEAAVRSLLGVPLIFRARLIGILTVYNKRGGAEFTEEDQRLLAILAGQSAQVIENARLYEEEKTLIRMQEELRLAYEIQRNLLPQEAPQLTGYEIAGTTRPAEAVGGDYFDFIPVEAQRLAFCVGDVSGKGLPAALLMANVQATLRGQAIGTSVRECLSRSNRLLCQRTGRNTFVTLFYGVLDVQHHRLHYGNAGHNRPLLLTPGQAPVRLTLGDLVLGFRPDYPYQEAALAFAPGQVLLVYSDGISEAMNADREQFGEERLAEALRRSGDRTAAALVEEILAAVRAHTGTAPQGDDMTLLAIKRTA